MTFIIYLWAFATFTWQHVMTGNIDLLECPPPDYPLNGHYGPKQPSYLPGDRIHYYCDVDTYIGGNYLRLCLDTGDWSGDTPVCDSTVHFEDVSQSSTAQPEDLNGANLAADGDRMTYSSTDPMQSSPGDYWMGTYAQPSHVLRVMLFLPTGSVSYEVLSIRNDGKEFSCGGQQRIMLRHEWTFHNCLEPNNTNIVAIKIKSLSSEPLRLLEVVTHALTAPTCVDPHVPVEMGQLILSRKSASLVCDRGYKPGRVTRIRCVRTGEWTRTTMYCIDREQDVESVPDNIQTDDRERE